MPGDTKVKRTAQGWVDVDEPSKFYNVRRLARLARRMKRLGQQVGGTNGVFPIRARQPQTVTRQVTAVGYTQPGNAPSMSTLQQRLYNRLTQTQNVDHDDALDMVLNNGYNKAASYGHMRAAGANHSEAKLVVDMNDPDVSLDYGKLRAQRFDHTSALTAALDDD